MKLKLNKITTSIRPQRVAYDAARRRANVYVSYNTHNRIQLSLCSLCLRQGLVAVSLSQREIASGEMQTHFQEDGFIPVQLHINHWTVRPGWTIANKDKKEETT